jgi:hypothetical protein
MYKVILWEKHMINTRIIKCRSCGKEIEQPYNPQGGGVTKIYCSSKCRGRQWARDNIGKNPKLKLEKKIVNRDWIRNTPEFKILHHARQRAREKGIEFSITLEDIKIPK